MGRRDRPENRTARGDLVYTKKNPIANSAWSAADPDFDSPVMVHWTERRPSARRRREQGDDDDDSGLALCD
jgi:hypothetical protein